MSAAVDHALHHGRHTQALADFASSLTFEDIPRDVTDRAVYLLLDGIGCGLHGATLPWSRMLTEAIAGMGAGGNASAWGSGRMVAADHAALLNGSYIQAFELDDYSRAGALHACALVLPAVAAAATLRRHVSGREFLAAMVAGFEVGNRIGPCLGTTTLTTQGWHTGSVIGPIPAAAAAGNLLGLDPGQLAHAFGIAATQAGGLMATQFGSMVKRMHHGRAAQSGLYAAQLAATGYTGIENVFEQPYGGYCSTFAGSRDGFDLDELVRGLGDDFRTADTCVKPYACCAKIHGVLDAVAELRALHPFRVDEVVEVRVRCTRATMEKTGWPYRGTGSATEAQMNLGYGVAVLLMEGDAFVHQYRNELLTDPDVVALAGHVRAEHDPTFDDLGESRRHHVHVAIELCDGTVLATERDFARGSSAAPLTDEEIVHKYDKIVATVVPGRGDDIRDLVLGIADLDDVEELNLALADT